MFLKKSNLLLQYQCLLEVVTKLMHMLVLKTLMMILLLYIGLLSIYTIV